MNKLNGKIFYERLKLKKGNCVLLRQILVETAYSSMYTDTLADLVQVLFYPWFILNCLERQIMIVYA